MVDGPELTGVFEQQDRHGDIYDTFRYNVVRVWQQPVEEVLVAGLPVLPLAPVSNVAVERVPKKSWPCRIGWRETNREQAATLWNATKILMGLRHEEKQVDAIIEGMSAMLSELKGSRNRRSTGYLRRRGEPPRVVLRALPEEARATLLVGPPQAGAA